MNQPPYGQPQYPGYAPWQPGYPPAPVPPPLAPAPATVRGNRGFGWPFWLILGVTVLLVLIAIAAGEIAAGLILGATIAVTLFLPRVFTRPLEIRLAEGSLHTGRRTVPFSAIAQIRVVSYSKAGTWAVFVGHGGKKLLGMSLFDTGFAGATGDQWAALGHVIAQASRGVNPAGGPKAARKIPPRRVLQPAAAMEILQAQAAWCRAGHRSAARRAPAAAIRPGTVIPLS